MTDGPTKRGVESRSTRLIRPHALVEKEIGSGKEKAKQIKKEKEQAKLKEREKRFRK